jgi:endonuclease/exonuclease/phosphatase family metal-dependent hydrolase
MSKWQITDTERIALPLIEEQDGLTQYFYLRRNILKTKIQLDEEDIYVLNIHASAYSTDGTKQEQINIFKAEIDELNDVGTHFIAGGDFNAIPPNSVNTIGDNFPDRPADLDEDFEVEDYDLTDMVAFYDDYFPAVSLENIASQEEVDNYISDYYTHSIYIDLENNIDWNRKLDYLFTNNTNGWIENSDITHQNTRQLSDHCPISVEMEVAR